MTAIIVMPRSHDYYGGGLCNYFGDSAVRDQSRQQADQHREVMGALRDLRKDTITVAVLSSAALPLCNAALDRLEGPARDYDAAMGKWWSRVRRIRDWQRKRQEAREGRQLEKRQQAEIAAYIARNRRWWRNAERLRKEAEREIGSPRSYAAWERSLRGMYRIGGEDYRDRYTKTRPQQPEGYDDLPTIRDLKSAASMAADAQLTVPVETVKRLMRWAP